LRLFCFISSVQILYDKFPDFIRRICGSSMRRDVAAGPSAATSSQFVARRRLAAETAPRTGISPRACVVKKTVDARCVTVQSYCIFAVFNFFYCILVVLFMFLERSTLIIYIEEWLSVFMSGATTRPRHILAQST
jgi:hypothetical protein